MSDGMKILPGQVTQLTSHEVESENRMVRQFAGCGFNGKAAPPLPIRAPGHGQGTEEERVERIVEILKAECKPRWVSGVLWADLARRILAAADAVPGPEVEDGMHWNLGQPPYTDGDGLLWQIDLDGGTTKTFIGAVDSGGMMVDLDYGDDQGWHSESVSRWIDLTEVLDSIVEPVPISAPPVTKGED